MIVPEIVPTHIQKRPQNRAWRMLESAFPNAASQGVTACREYSDLLSAGRYGLVLRSHIEDRQSAPDCLSNRKRFGGDKTPSETTLTTTS